MKSKFLPPIILLIFFAFIFKDLFLGRIPISTDIMVGAYFPWLNSRWGFSVGVPVKNALLSDPFSAFFIQKTLVSDLLKSFTLPLWNRYILAGTPLLATYHTNPFFPATWLLMLPRFTGWQLFIGLSPFSAALFMYLFISCHVKSKPAALAAAVVFSLAGLMTTWMELGTAVWSISILPLTLFIADRIIAGQKKFYPLLTLSIALLIFAGNVQISTYSALIIFAYLLFFAKSRTQFFQLLLFSILGIGLSAIQLYPTFDLYRHSIRAAENYSSTFNYGLVKFPQLVRLFIADFFGNPATGNHWGEYEYQEYSSFLGTLTIPLVLLTFFQSPKSRFLKFFQSLFFISLFLVILHPLSRLIFSLPLPLLTYSLASRLFFITAFSAAILTALSLENFKPNRLLSIFSFLFIILTFLAIYFAPPDHRQVAFRNSILPFLLLGGLFVLSFLTISRKYSLLILLFIFCFDLGRYFSNLLLLLIHLWFIRPHPRSNLSKNNRDYSALLGKILIFCHPIPGLPMVWNQLKAMNP